MKLRSISTALVVSSLLLGTSGCKDFYDVNVDPIHPIKADLQQLLPVTQTAASTYLGFSIAGIGQATSALMGQLSNGRGIGTYQQNGDSFGNQWGGLYSDMLANNEQIITQGTAEQRLSYVGIAQIQKAYVISQMVDMFGDIPYSEALKGAANLAPRYDKDADIYNGNPGLGIQSLFSLIDDGIANLDKGKGVIVRNDLIYEGDLAKWARLGRTLKLKLYVQIRKTRADGFRPEISALLANPSNLMSSAPNNDFEFKYGTSSTPANRNIGFLADYVDVGRENSIGRYLYLLMRYGNGVRVPSSNLRSPDPRISYYFFNQQPAATAAASTATYDFQDPARPAFITIRQGSTGPASNGISSNTRTLPGLYPVGGRWDDGRGGNANTTFGRGSVAQRLLPFFSLKFLEAEAQLVVLNDRMAARTALEAAIDASFAKVNAIALAEGTSTPATPSSPPSQTPINPLVPPPVLGVIPPLVIEAYRNAVLARFDAAAQPLQIIMEEKYVSSFGMGPDIYTDWRRTGFPIITVPDNANIGSNAGLVEDGDADTRGAGLFPRRLFYSQGSLTANPNPAAPKRQLTESDANYRIFWDR